MRTGLMIDDIIRAAEYDRTGRTHNSADPSKPAIPKGLALTAALTQNKIWSIIGERNSDRWAAADDQRQLLNDCECTTDQGWAAGQVGWGEKGKDAQLKYPALIGRSRVTGRTQCPPPEHKLPDSPPFRFSFYYPPACTQTHPFHPIDLLMPTIIHHHRFHHQFHPFWRLGFR